MRFDHAPAARLVGVREDGARGQGVAFAEVHGEDQIGERHRPTLGVGVRYAHDVGLSAAVGEELLDGVRNLALRVDAAELALADWLGTAGFAMGLASSLVGSAQLLGIVPLLTAATRALALSYMLAFVAGTVLAIGFVVWGDVPTIGLLVGSAIVVCSGLFLLLRESRR